MAVFLFAGVADGLMDKLGPIGFMAVGLVVMGVVGAQVEAGWSIAEEGVDDEKTDKNNRL